MAFDPEMEEWRSHWSTLTGIADRPKTSNVIIAARRHQLRSNIGLAANVAFGILLILGSLLISRRMNDPELVLWAATVWITTLVAMLLAFNSWRESRIRNFENVASFAALQRHKARAEQRNVRAGSVFLAIVVSIGLGWLTADLIAGRIRFARYAAALGIQLALAAGWGCIFAYIWKRSNAVLEPLLDDDTSK